MSIEALNWGKTFSAEAQTLRAIAVTVILPPASSARGANFARNCSSSVISARSCWVTWGIVFQAWRRCSAVLRRTPRIETRSILPHLGKSGRSGSTKAPRGACAAAAAAAQAPRGAFVDPDLPDFPKWGKIERVSIRGVRRKTAEHLRQAWNTIPHVTQQDRADITELEQLRAKFAPRAEEAGGKMTVTAIALKVCASALKVFPQFNASIDMAKEEIVYKQYINIGVAVDTDRGLLVPVIRDVDKKNIVELATELTHLSLKAREKKLTPDEKQGGTFTIPNLGGIGGDGFSPIVNHPEVAILGLSRSSMAPVWVNGKFEPRLVLPLSLSYDHRLIDGADAARFLRWIAEAFEQPFLLSVQG